MSYRLTDTTSVYMYESDSMQSSEARVQDRLTVLDSKINQKLQEIEDKNKLQLNQLKNELKGNQIKIDKLTEYIKLPWYKKLFINFKKYERNI